MLLLGTAGCSHRENDELTKGVVSGEAKRIAMEGTDTFFGGQVVAKVTVARGIGRGLSGGKGENHTGETNRDEEQRKTYHDFADASVKVMLGSPLPPVTLHLVLTNPGAGPLIVDIQDFESDLGNFAVDPEILTLAPGASGEPTSMVSYLGVNEDEIPFKVTLALGKKKETRQIVVRNLLDTSNVSSPGPSGP